MNAEHGPVSRREVLCGGLLAGLALLSGCQTRRSTAALPGPRWPSDPGQAPAITRRPDPWTYTPPPTPAPSPSPATLEPVVARTQWTRAGVARPSEAYAMGGITRITVHHDAISSADLRLPGQVASRLEAIRNAHVGRGWADIGYHYAIDPSGRIWEARSTRLQGAHVKDHNEQNLGIVVLGNFDNQQPTPQALAALDRFIASQMIAYRVPLTRVYTHQEFSATACPGRLLQGYMVQTRSSGGRLALAAGGRSTLG